MEVTPQLNSYKCMGLDGLDPTEKGSPSEHLLMLMKVEKLIGVSEKLQWDWIYPQEHCDQEILSKSCLRHLKTCRLDNESLSMTDQQIVFCCIRQLERSRCQQRVTLDLFCIFFPVDKSTGSSIRFVGHQ